MQSKRPKALKYEGRLYLDKDEMERRLMLSSEGFKGQKKQGFLEAVYRITDMFFASEMLDMSANQSPCLNKKQCGKFCKGNCVSPMGTK